VRKNNISLWLKGDLNPLNSNGVIKPFIRRYMFEINDNKCIMCGWNKMNNSTNLIPLEIDHIDGNYQNNDITNLRLLCPNCHSLTPTYKNSNKGKGRQNRVVR
jgi:nitrate reductase cytochrome c-type subunit